MTDISYWIGLIIGYSIPIVVVALIAGAVLKMTLDKVNGMTIKYSKAFLLTFIAYLISFIVGGNLGIAVEWVGFSRILLICFLYLAATMIIFYIFLEIDGKKLIRKDLAMLSSAQSVTVLLLLTLILLITS